MKMELKKLITQLENTKEGTARRINQAQDRISVFKDKVEDLETK